VTELIEMLFGRMTCVSPRNHTLDADPDPAGRGTSKETRAIVKYLCMSSSCTVCLPLLANVPVHCMQQMNAISVITGDKMVMWAFVKLL